MTYLSVAQRKEIILAILRGQESSAFKKYRVSVLDQISLVAAAERLTASVAGSTSPIRKYYALPRRTPLGRGYFAAGIAVLFPLFCAGWIASHIDVMEAANLPVIGAVSTLIGVSVAALGWGVASWTSHRNARAQHTLNFLATRFSSSAFSDQAAIFNKAFVGKIINNELVKTMVTSKNAEDVAAVQAMRWLLNWFEFISVGIVIGDLDLEIVTKTVRGNLIHYCDKCMIYIQEVRLENPKTLENLVELRRAFEGH